MIFRWGPRPKGRKRPKQGEVLGRGKQALSPPARESGGTLRAPPAGFGAEPRPPKGLPLFSALTMASPGTIKLLPVDYHAAVGGQDPRAL